ncbi:hypothetical protein ACN9MN_06025 [Chryseobacterium sp. S-02]|uniref:hypothetical protein n=1 Tax=Chryseobacterium sp. S-02 TaxID=3404064 RepID=UPI003CE95168
MLFEEIQSKIWGLYPSAGTSPFTFLHFEVDEEIKDKVSEEYLYGYTQGIAFFLRDNYAVEDYIDYLTLSKQFLMIEDENQRDNFLIVQAAKMTEDKEIFLQWQYSQIFIALGFALHELRAKATKYKEVESSEIDFFKQAMNINCGILKELILFQEIDLPRHDQ